MALAIPWVQPASERHFWLTASLRAWSDAMERPEKRSKLFGETVTRASLFEPTAMVMQMTPAQVPYQNGRLYKYLAISLIPRAIWPDKPSFSEANQFYQVAYGITDRRDLGKVSMAVGIAGGVLYQFWMVRTSACHVDHWLAAECHSPLFSRCRARRIPPLPGHCFIAKP